MKTITVKRVRDLQGADPGYRLKKTAKDGVRILVDGENILGDDADHDSSFCNYDYESTDGYAAMSLLRSLEEHGVLKLKCDKDVREHYFPKKS